MRPVVKRLVALFGLEHDGKATRPVRSQNQNLFDVGGAAGPGNQTYVRITLRNAALLDQGESGFQIRDELVEPGVNDMAVGDGRGAAAAAAR